MMILGIKLKNKKVITYSSPSKLEVLIWLYEGSNYFSKITNGSYSPFTGNSYIRELYPEYSEVLFRDIDIINHLGFHLNTNGMVVKNKINLSQMKECEYSKYKFSTSEKDVEFGNISPTHLITNGMQYTFGIEIETSGGCLPSAIALANKLNVSSIYDGSIKGGEYVTGVLKGDAGFIHLNKILSLLRQTTTINKTCGIHVHIGGAEFNKAFTVFSYLLGMRMELEIFETLPPSRSHNRYCDYLYKLTNNLAPSIGNILDTFQTHGYEAGVDIVYDQLYTAMTYGDKPGENNNKLHCHKYGRYTGQYSDVEMDDNFRYKWLNLIPCNFNMKEAWDMESVKNRSTIEFRNHSASLSFIKIRNWILFTMAFTSFVENHKNRILDPNPIYIDDVLTSAFGRKANYLIEYFKERKSIFNEGNENVEYNASNEVELIKKKDICVL